MPDAYMYLFLDAFTIIGPLALSFDQKVAYYKDWKYLYPALFTVSFFYLLWDVWFTKCGIWEFNHQYLLGPSFLDLPFEEYAFFFVVPFSCVFIYRCLQAYCPKINLPTHALYYGMLFISLALTISFLGKLYTTVTFGLISVSMIILRLSSLWETILAYFNHLWLAWAVSMIPMFYVNGKLTGLPVLIYNNSENMFVRIGSIPFEDFFYNFLLILWIVILFEHRKSKAKLTKPA